MACMGVTRNTAGFLWGNLKERNSFEELHGWQDSINMHLTYVGWEGLDWFDLAENRYRWRFLVNTVKILPTA